MRKFKNRYFYHIFVSTGDAHGAITLNVVWTEREFDAYKLSRCMCPSNCNRFWDTAIYLWKNRHFITTPLHSTPPLGGSRRNIGPPWYGKTRIMSLPDGENISKICLFVLTWSTNVTDRQTLHDSKDRAYASHRAVKKICRYCVRNANEFPQSPYSTMVREMEKWSAIRISVIGLSPKVNQF